MLICCESFSKKWDVNETGTAARQAQTSSVDCPIELKVCPERRLAKDHFQLNSYCQSLSLSPWKVENVEDHLWLFIHRYGPWLVHWCALPALHVRESKAVSCRAQGPSQQQACSDGASQRSQLTWQNVRLCLACWDGSNRQIVPLAFWLWELLRAVHSMSSMRKGLLCISIITIIFTSFLSQWNYMIQWFYYLLQWTLHVRLDSTIV